MVAHLLWEQGVAGSSPVTSTKDKALKCFCFRAFAVFKMAFILLAEGSILVFIRDKHYTAHRCDVLQAKGVSAMVRENDCFVREGLFLDQVSIKEWDKFSLAWQARVPGFPSSFPQSGNMAYYLEENGKTCFPLILKDKRGQGLAGGLFSLYPAMKVFRIAKCNQGPLLDYLDSELVSAFLESVTSFLKQKGVVHLTITPNIECQETLDEVNSNLAQAGFRHDGFQNTYINGVGRWFFVKDFRTIKNPDQLWSSYSSKSRNHINKAKRYSLHCEELAGADLKVFADLMEHTAERRDFSSRLTEYYQEFLRCYDRGNARAMIVMAYINPDESLQNLQNERVDLESQCRQLERDIANGAGKRSVGALKSRKIELKACDENIDMISTLLPKGPKIYLSGATFVTYNGEMTYLFSGSYQEYFGLCAAQLIQHYAQTRGLEYGISRYNYYGTMGKHSGQQDEGILDFKRGFGGRLLEQPGNYSLAIRKPWGQVYQRFFKG